jgi:hypothetical protein
LGIETVIEQAQSRTHLQDVLRAGQSLTAHLTNMRRTLDAQSIAT